MMTTEALKQAIRDCQRCDGSGWPDGEPCICRKRMWKSLEPDDCQGEITDFRSPENIERIWSDYLERAEARRQGRPIPPNPLELLEDYFGSHSKRTKALMKAEREFLQYHDV